MSSAQLGPHTSGPALYRFLPPPRRHSDRRSGLQERGGRAVDTIRVLAAGAVQKGGNGHPGTAMSLAPLAGTQQLGEPDRLLRPQPHLDRGRHQDRAGPDQVNTDKAHRAALGDEEVAAAAERSLHN